MPHDYESSSEEESMKRDPIKKRRPVKPKQKANETENKYRHRLDKYKKKMKIYKHEKKYHRSAKMVDINGKDVIAVTNKVTHRKSAPKGNYKLTIVRVAKPSGGHEKRIAVIKSTKAGHSTPYTRLWAKYRREGYSAKESAEKAKAELHH